MNASVTCRLIQALVRRLVAALVMGVLLYIVGAGCGGESAGPEVIINQRRWSVELAVTFLQRYQGLSGRTNLAEDVGMLFVYPDARVRGFCMRGCLIPLDVAFIGSDLRVVKICTMSVEPDHAGRVIYSSDVPIQYVLEVRAGGLARAGVAVGDKVLLQGKIPDAAKAAPDP
ncbi:MAG: DUF192 domain-containing protein [Phycisphaerae bacterium]|nr:DUF192 domain-containing protein [Phycisphaerae bacterium]